MILRFRAEPGQASNLRVRIYSQDRSTLLATITSGITETISASGSYECEVGSLTGYWFVLVDLVDTGEITADGFASQWLPELQDTIVTSAGLGSKLVTVTVNSTGAVPVPNAIVTITNSAGNVTIAWGPTDSSGQIVFALDAGSYKVAVRGPSSLYGALSPQSLTVTGSTSATYTLTLQAISPPASPSLATVRFFVLDAGSPVSGAKVTAELEGFNSTVDTALVLSAVHTGTTDANGVVDLVMIQKASFTRGGVYRVKVFSGGRCSHDRRVTVPSSASLYAEDLPDA